MGAGVGTALAGLKPVVKMRVVDFALCAMDEIVNQAAKEAWFAHVPGPVGAMTAMLLLLTFVPELVLFLPRWLGYL